MLRALALGAKPIGGGEPVRLIAASVPVRRMDRPPCRVEVDGAFDLRPDLRELLLGQHIAVAEHDGPENRVFELPDISRPVIGLEHGKRARRRWP